MEFNLEGFIKRDEGWVNKAKEVYAIQEKRRQLEKLEAIMMAELKSVSEEKNSHGGGFILESYERAGNVEYGKIPELKTVNLERYRKEPVVVWRLKNLTMTV
jgi:hypothetical protein